MKDFPHFLRFNEVGLVYYGTQSLSEQCQLFINQLQRLKRYLKDTNLIDLNVTIQNDSINAFGDHFQFIDHFSNELLPICDSSRGYSFLIHFGSDTNSGTDVIASILQAEQVKRCSKIEVEFRHHRSIQLQFDVIFDWLNEKADLFGRRNTEKFLQICSWKRIKNAAEISSDFMEV